MNGKRPDLMQKHEAELAKELGNAKTNVNPPKKEDDKIPKTK